MRRPVLRYFGGKFRIAPWIIDQFPDHRIYVEAFGGGASVLMRKARSYGEVYNDLDGEVVNVFRVLQRHPEELRRLLEVTPYARDELEMAYIPCEEPVERARRTIIRSFMGFGSDSITRDCRTGFRANSNRSGTTPAHDWARWPLEISAFHERLTGVVIENRDAKVVMESQDSEHTLHFLDPPYPHDTRADKSSRHGYRHEMTDLDHEELCEFIAELKGAVILCGYETELYDRLGWETVRRRTHIFGNQHRTEVLWLNPKARMAQASLFSR